MPKYIMALDSGTTSNRCILFDHNGNICSVAQKEFTQHFPAPGWVEHDAMEIFSTQLEVAQQAMQNAGVSASDISKAERGELDLTQAALKEIAKATGVTQASLLNAAKGTSSKSASGKKSTAAKSSMQVTSAERKLVELYRKADSDTKKEALKVLKGEDSLGDDLLEMLLDGVQDMLSGK